MDTTLRLESYVMSARPNQKLRVHSDGKVKTSLNALAKGTQTYEFGKCGPVVSDAAKFNQLTNAFDRDAKRWIHTQYLAPVREVQRFNTIAHNVRVAEYNSANRLLTAVLLFKGIGYLDVRRDLTLFPIRKQETIDRLYAILATLTEATRPDLQRIARIKHTIGKAKHSKPSVTYAVNTHIYYGEPELCTDGVHRRAYAVLPRITVKRSFEDGLFFDSRCCQKTKIIFELYKGFNF